MFPVSGGFRKPRFPFPGYTLGGVRIFQQAVCIGDGRDFCLGLRDGYSMSTIDELFQREHPGHLLRAIAELHRNLGSAFKKAAQGRNELWPANRNEIVTALISVAWFFHELEMSGGVEGFDAYANVFNEFSSVLADLDRGSKHAIFSEKGRKGGKGKPPDNTDIMCARCRVAIAVAYMMHVEANQKSKGEIARDIEVRHQSLKRLVRKGGDHSKPLRRSIVSWYEEFSQGKVKNQEARDLYRSYMHLLAISQRRKTSSSDDLSREARRQLRLAAAFAPVTIDETLSLSNFIEPKRISRRI